MGNQAGIIIRNVKNELFHSAKRLILNEVKGIECLQTVGYAYRIENLQRFEEARELCEFGMERGPQDYCYVED